MALKNTAPVSDGFKAKFNWVTQAGASTLRNLPFGGALGVVAAGIVLWLAPHLIPDGWSAEAVLSLGMGAGVVVHRLFVGTFGWFIEPMKRHLGSRWEAWIQLGKLEKYSKRGMIQPEQVHLLTDRIVQQDITAKQKGRR
jgi:hypothetical protein